MVGAGGAAGCARGCGVECDIQQGLVFRIDIILQESVSGVVEAGFGGAVGPGVETGGAGVEKKKNGVDSSKREVLDVFGICMMDGSGCARARSAECVGHSVVYICVCVPLAQKIRVCLTMHGEEVRTSVYLS